MQYSALLSLGSLFFIGCYSDTLLTTAALSELQSLKKEEIIFSDDKPSHGSAYPFPKDFESIVETKERTSLPQEMSELLPK